MKSPSDNLVLDIRDAGKSYRMGNRVLHVLKNLHLQVETGEYLAIMGPSGSGKSTLLHIVGLLDHLETGNYALDGLEVTNLSDSSLAKFRNRKIGFVFQRFNLFPQYNILGNIEVPMIYRQIPRKQRRKRARELAAMVGLQDRLHHTPGQLSGGETQRTAIARALANDPSLILADEPTGNLDEKTGENIMTIFDKLVEAGRTVVFVTHNPEYKKHVQRVLTLHDGRLIPE
ncbi:MAG: ABC transporter ATP-binding protein [Lentisphaeria bacterium]